MRRLAPAVALSVAALAAAAAPALAGPVCTTPGTEAACGGRVVAEPSGSTTFVQFDGVAEDLGRTLAAIEAIPGASRYLEVMTMAERTGDATHVSTGGRPLWLVRLTDETVTVPKAQAAVSLSVHGLEAAGREGGVRYVEDIARWASTAPTTLLYGGDVGLPVSEVLARTETWIGFTNSDGWAAGDVDSTSPGGFVRGNSRGADLNRDLATVGWYDEGGGRGLAESEPETRAWTTVVKGLTNLKTSTDIHGELTTPNGAFSDLIIPAGQWGPKRQEQVDAFSRRMIKTVERKFAADPVANAFFLANIPATGSTPTRPANVAAAYDIVGYDDSGFMGDWFSQTQGAVHMDVENFLSNLAPNNAFSGPLEQAHAAAVRGNIEATIVEALLTDAVTPSADLGRVAYVGDPVRTRSADGVGSPLPAGRTQVPYDVSRLDYFPVLAAEHSASVAQVGADSVAEGADLSGYDTLVVTDMIQPAGTSASLASYVAALRDFASDGGQLLLTDRALGLLDDLALVPTAALTIDRTNAGHVDFVAPLGDHPYEQGLVGLPSQTYYEVMLGFPPEAQGAAGPFAPNYGVTRTAWTAAGGTTVATVGPEGGASDRTALGTIPLGAGRVTIFGAVLPEQVEALPGFATPHPFGLAPFAVTITGGQVMDNVLTFRRTTLANPVVPEVGLALALPLSAGVVLMLLLSLQRRRTRAAQR